MLILTRRTTIAGAFATLATAAHSAPQPYRLLKDKSTVTFTFLVNGSAQTGRVPVSTADIRVDPGNLARSSAEVTADIREARTGFGPVTQALLSASVLDAKTHPVVSFRSTRIRLGAQGRISEGARIEGDLTLRGVTAPLSLDAKLSRPAGSAPDDLSELYVDLTGALSRNTWGASGYADFVADGVRIDIHAEIRARA
ncbi:YceI family protein [uncultured Roseobacter sp.]|uniref:YceI family protein n=1 Tax=uncultured Roseobacter sp. TaxID=114847 RepID=UPI00263A074E|nr:YceI family protein [uncultured Roseobacter sp.]